MRPLKLGIVPYYNMLPLIQGLEDFFPRERWLRATPRELAAALSTGGIDVAAVSIFESLRGAAGYAVVPGAAIGSNGPVRSVSLCSKVPYSSVRRILLDRASLSSSSLMRVLAGEYLGIAPEFELSEQPLQPGFDWRADLHDGFLVIGDTALAWEHAFPHRLDLGEAWRALTGLPFVYAAWTVRAGLELSADEIAVFSIARQRGEAAVGRIVASIPADAMATVGGAESLRSYLAGSIRYGLGARELEAIDLYRRKLVAAGLLPPGSPPLRVAGDV